MSNYTEITCSSCGAVDNVRVEEVYITSPDGRSFKAGNQLICGNCGREITEEDEKEDN